MEDIRSIDGKWRGGRQRNAFEACSESICFEILPVQSDGLIEGLLVLGDHVVLHVGNQEKCLTDRIQVASEIVH